MPGVRQQAPGRTPLADWPILRCQPRCSSACLCADANTANEPCSVAQQQPARKQMPPLVKCRGTHAHAAPSQPPTPAAALLHAGPARLPVPLPMHARRLAWCARRRLILPPALPRPDAAAATAACCCMPLHAAAGPARPLHAHCSRLHPCCRPCAQGGGLSALALALQCRTPAAAAGQQHALQQQRTAAQAPCWAGRARAAAAAQPPALPAARMSCRPTSRACCSTWTAQAAWSTCWQSAST